MSPDSMGMTSTLVKVLSQLLAPVILAEGIQRLSCTLSELLDEKKAVSSTGSAIPSGLTSQEEGGYQLAIWFQVKNFRPHYVPVCVEHAFMIVSSKQTVPLTYLLH